LRFLSLFSGIEAASVAWNPLGWECVGFSEIEPFPCAVLKHHYPNVPNLGDITKITEDQIRALGPIDLVVGGFPCQDVSVAGKRAGLVDEEGNATRSGLFFEAMRIVEIAAPRYLVLENVPGLYSSNKGQDFATVVGEILGARYDIPKGGWKNAGCAYSERGLLEWSTLDARYFNLAQRRKRVFLVADFGNWRDRPPILLESESMCGHPAPSGKAKQRTSRGIEIGSYGGRFTELNPTLDARAKDGPIRNQNAGGYCKSGKHICKTVANTLTAKANDRWEPTQDNYIVER
jgi:DNA (cytosine-5)-methyltransferase 1